METLTRNDLMTLEAYAQERPAFRQRAYAHKRQRTVHLGKHVTLLFEDRLTVQYQVQEMLRIERIFEADAIQEELDAYNPLIPDGDNLKATMMIEYPDESERREKLKILKGIEDRVFVAVGAGSRRYAIADEDLERANDEKTSAVHFLRFQLSADDIAAAKSGNALTVGVDHPAYAEMLTLDGAARKALVADFA